MQNNEDSFCYINEINNKEDLFKKFEELIKIARLPIQIIDDSLYYGETKMKRDGDKYYYSFYDIVIMVTLNNKEISITSVDEETFMQIVASFKDGHKLDYYNVENNILKHMSIDSKDLVLSKSNTLPNEFNDLLNDLGIKYKLSKSKSIEMNKLSYSLPKLLENEARMYVPMQYIPETSILLIQENIGKYYEVKRKLDEGTYLEENIKVIPNPFKNELFPKRQIKKGEPIIKRINPTSIVDVKQSLAPLRKRAVVELTIELMYNQNEDLTKYITRYFSDVFYSIGYFQNEDINKFYVFEDDLIRLQLK